MRLRRAGHNSQSADRNKTCLNAPKAMYKKLGNDRYNSFSYSSYTYFLDDARIDKMIDLLHRSVKNKMNLYCFIADLLPNLILCIIIKNSWEIYSCSVHPFILKFYHMLLFIF